MKCDCKELLNAINEKHFLKLWDEFYEFICLDCKKYYEKVIEKLKKV